MLADLGKAQAIYNATCLVYARRRQLVTLQILKAPTMAVVLASEALRLAIQDLDKLTGSNSFNASEAAYAAACEA